MLCEEGIAGPYVFLSSYSLTDRYGQKETKGSIDDSNLRDSLGK